MSSPKTRLNVASVTDFINTVEDKTRKEDAFLLLDLFSKITAEEPKMWGTSIIGFGLFHYKSDRSSQEGDWALTGFSPRKQNSTLYFMDGFDGHEELLDKLGKHKTSASCLYINKLSDVDMGVLEKLITESFQAMKKKYDTVSK